MPRIFLLTHFKDDSEEMQGPYSSIQEAVEQQDSDGEFSYCGELCKTAHSRPYWLNRTDDFIAEWVRQEEESLTDKFYTEGGDGPKETLEHYLEVYARGPRMRVPSQRSKFLEAAE